MILKRNALAAVFAGGILLTAATGFLAASAADSATEAAPATPPEGGHWHHHGWGPWRMYGKLGLTPEQKTAVKAIMDAAKPQMKTLHTQAEANRLKLMQTSPADSSYATVVAEVAKSDAALASQRATQAAELRAEVYNTVLTPEQRTQLAALQLQWAAKIAAREAEHAAE